MPATINMTYDPLATQEREQRLRYLQLMDRAQRMNMDIHQQQLLKEQEENRLSQQPITGTPYEDMMQEAFPTYMGRRAEHEVGRQGEMRGAQNFDFTTSPESAYTPAGMERPVIRTQLPDITMKEANRFFGAAQGTLGVMSRQDQLKTAKGLREFITEKGKDVFTPQQFELLSGQLENLPKTDLEKVAGIITAKLKPQYGDLERKSMAGLNMFGQFNPENNKWESAGSHADQNPVAQVVQHPETGEAGVAFINPQNQKIEIKPLPGGYGAKGATKEAWTFVNKETGEPQGVQYFNKGIVPSHEDPNIQAFKLKDYQDMMNKKGISVNVGPEGTSIQLGGAATPGSKTAGGFPAPEQAKRPLAGEQQLFIDQMMVIEKTIDDLTKNFGEAIETYTGPISARINKMVAKVKGHPDFAALQARNATLMSVVYGLSGKQLAEWEKKWLKEDILPELIQPTENYWAKMKQFDKWTTDILDTRIQNLSKNYSVGTEGRLKSRQPKGKAATGKTRENPLDQFWENK